MKKIFFSFMLLATGMLFACQPTPKNDFIVNRNDESIEEIILRTASPSSTGVEKDLDNNGVNETWCETIMIGNVTCVIDAPIQSLDGPKGVYEVVKEPFDANVIQAFLNHYVSDPIEAYPSRDTVEELEQVLQRILRGEEYEAEDGSLQYRPYDGQEEDAKKVMDQISQAKKQTETYKPKELPIDTLPINYTYVLTSGTRWSIRCNESRFYARTYRKMSLQSETGVRLGFSRKGESYGATIGAVSISKDDAISKAEEVGQQLGAEHLGVAHVEKGRIIHPYTEDIISKGWIIILARNDGNCIPVDVSRTTMGILQYEPSEYAPPWGPEQMRVYVDENGVQSIEWTNRMHIKEAINENVLLLPLSDIQEKVRMLLRYGLTWLGTQESTEIRITEMRLTTLLCKKKNDMVNALLMPAWVITYENTDSFGTTLTTIIAVNALDGSRMDPLQVIIDESDN